MDTEPVIKDITPNYTVRIIKGIRKGRTGLVVGSSRWGATRLWKVKFLDGRHYECPRDFLVIVK